MTHTTPGSSAASSSLSRRRFFSVTAVAGAATVVTARSAGAAAAASTGPSVTTSGADLAGWETVLGDALYAGPNQSPVSTNDIQTVNSGSFSTLRANIQRRGVMAHNIAFKRVIDNGLFDNVHVLSYQFRMPYLPTTSAWPDNAQTVEGGFFIWDAPAPGWTTAWPSSGCSTLGSPTSVGSTPGPDPSGRPPGGSPRTPCGTRSR